MHPRRPTGLGSTEPTSLSTTRLLERTFSSTRTNVWFDALTSLVQDKIQLPCERELYWPAHPPTPTLAARFRSIFNFKRRCPVKDGSTEAAATRDVQGPVANMLYPPHGKFAWLVSKRIVDSEIIKFIGGFTCSTHIKRGKVQDESASPSPQTLTYINKCWPRERANKRNGFYSELALYKASQYLRPLQGSVVPHLIGVYSGSMGISFAMEPPHPVFWTEAHRDIPRSLKLKIVDAYKRIHAQGVLHADVALRHMLIGADASVTIIDFAQSRALVPDAAFLLPRTSSAELSLEIRRVKFVLDLDGARFKEELKTQWYETQKELAKKIKKRRSPKKIVFRYEDDDEPPLSPNVLNEWKFGSDNAPERFVMPGVDDKTLSAAVAEFLMAIEDLESAGITDSGCKGTSFAFGPCPAEARRGSIGVKPCSPVDEGSRVGETVIPCGEQGHPSTGSSVAPSSEGKATGTLKRPRDDDDYAGICAGEITAKRPKHSVDPAVENATFDGLGRPFEPAGRQSETLSPGYSRRQRAEILSVSDPCEEVDVPTAACHNTAVVKALSRADCNDAVNFKPPAYIPLEAGKTRSHYDEAPPSGSGNFSLLSNTDFYPPNEAPSPTVASHDSSSSCTGLSRLGRVSSSPILTPTEVSEGSCVSPGIVLPGVSVTTRQLEEECSLLGRKRKRREVDDVEVFPGDQCERPSRRRRLSTCAIA